MSRHIATIAASGRVFHIFEQCMKNERTLARRKMSPNVYGCDKYDDLNESVEHWICRHAAISIIWNIIIWFRNICRPHSRTRRVCVCVWVFWLDASSENKVKPASETNGLIPNVLSCTRISNRTPHTNYCTHTHTSAFHSKLTDKTEHYAKIMNDI